MSHQALTAYNAARDGQRDRNEARRIRTIDARGSRHDAGVHWPFELLQNALDAGPRPGREHVEIRLRREEGWLRDNRAALELLRKFFGYDALELQLLGATPDEELRQELDRIARIVEVAGNDPGRYEKLIDHLHAVERQDRLVKRCRELGLAIQAALGEALAGLDLEVKVIDHGFDFEVESLEDAADDIEVGSFIVEVKATTTGDAKLTPKQAEVASKSGDRFVLCVVDLRGVTTERLDQPWTAAGVLALARMVPGIGSRVQLVTQAPRPESMRSRSETRGPCGTQYRPRYGRRAPRPHWVVVAFNRAKVQGAPDAATTEGAVK